jgi:hypothetical protein
LKEDENLLLLNGEDKTSQVKRFERRGHKTDVYF